MEMLIIIYDERFHRLHILINYVLCQFAFVFVIVGFVLYSIFSMEFISFEQLCKNY